MNRYPENTDGDRADETLDQAIKTMQQLTMPDGPPPEVEAALIERVQRQAANPRGHGRGIFTMKNITRYAAALVLGGLVVTLVVIGLGNPTPAFADIKQKVIASQTLTCMLELIQSRDEGASPVTITMTMKAKNPGWLRQEMVIPQGNGKTTEVINIVSYKQGRIVNLVPEHKTASAMKFDLNDFGQNPQNMNIVDEFTKIDEEHVTFAGRDELDGREMLLYEIDLSHMGAAHSASLLPGGGTIKIWVDPETHLPHRMYIDASNSIGMTMNMTDFEWDVELDDSLFSLEIPDDYHITNMDMAGVDEKDLVAMYRACAEIDGGVFPKQIDPEYVQNALIKYLTAIEPEKRKAESERLATLFGRGFLYSATFMEGGEIVYRGEGVKLGDADAVICYFREKDSETYRVIRGDLSIHDATRDELPTE